MRDDDVLVRFIACGTRVLDFVDDIHTFNDLSEDDMLVVEEGSWDSGNEELTSIGVRTRILVRGT